MCADNSTRTNLFFEKLAYKKYVMGHVSCVMHQMSCVRCQMWAGLQRPKNYNFFTQQIIETLQIKGLLCFFNISNTIIDQKYTALSVPVVDGGEIIIQHTTYTIHMDIATY